MSLSFSGKTVVITGSSRGIGLGIARRFAEAGARLHLIANDAAVHDRARELAASGAEADIADRQAIAAALAPIARIDVLINNAGLELMTPISDSSDEIETAFRRIIEINVIGTALVTARALPLSDTRLAHHKRRRPSVPAPRRNIRVLENRCSELQPTLAP